MAVSQLWFSAIILSAVHGTTSQDLIFGLIGQQPWSSEAKCGVEDALNNINNNLSHILSGYSLKYFQYNPGSPTTEPQTCSREAALTELFGQIFNSSHQIVALISLGCSMSTGATAEISQYYNIIQLSCASSSYDLSDGTRLPYYFQLLPSEVNLARVFYSIIKEHGWRRVAIIVQNEHRFITTMKNLKLLLMNQSLSYIERVLDAEGSVDEHLFDPQARIFVIATDSKHARKITCMAHRQGKRYPKHVFLMYGDYESRWWSIHDDDDSLNGDSILLNCSPKERAEVLQYSLAALHFHSQRASVPLLLTCTFPNFVDERKRDNYYTEFGFHDQCYDAVFALALALNKTIEELNANATLNGIAREQAGLPSGSPFHITDFNYNVSIVANLLMTFFEDTKFIGLSGPVQFDQDGIREVTRLRVFQYRATYINGTRITADDNTSASVPLDQRLRLIEVAHVGEDGASLEFLSSNIWPSLVPRDGLPDSAVATIFVPLSAIFILLDVCGLAFATVCLVFNVLFRDKKLIRLTSPNLNYLMIIGTSLMYFSGVMYVIPVDTPSEASSKCFIRMWLLIFGYSCGFGTIVAKLWRVHYIFRNPQATKRKSGIQDWHLASFVLALLALNVFILVLHISLEGAIAKFEVQKVVSRENPSDEQGDLGIPIEFSIYECSTHPWIRIFILATVYTCFGLLQVCALYFAFQTRKVKVKGLNDAKYIAVIVYITTVVLTITLVTSFALSSFVNTFASINSIGIWTSATVILGVMFIPKMVRLYKDPEGERVFTAHEEALHVATVQLQGAPQSPVPQLQESEVDLLKKRVQQMEGIIKEYMTMTGLDITKRWLTSSADGVQNQNNGGPIFQLASVDEANILRQSSKVSFELGHLPSVPAQGNSEKQQ